MKNKEIQIRLSDTDFDKYLRREYSTRESKTLADMLSQLDSDELLSALLSYIKEVEMKKSCWKSSFESANKLIELTHIDLECEEKSIAYNEFIAWKFDDIEGFKAHIPTHQKIKGSKLYFKNAQKRLLSYLSINTNTTD